MQFNRIRAHDLRVSTILNKVTRLVCGLLVAIGAVTAPAASQTANPPARKSTPAATYFSGTVTDIKADSITVVRKLPAKDPVTRTFQLDSKTTIEGAMHDRARVTVRYGNQEDGSLRAIHIIVRK
jgi:hypothetical protein